MAAPSLSLQLGHLYDLDYQFSLHELQSILDQAYSRLKSPTEDGEAAFAYLTAALASARASSLELWVKSGLETIRRHPLWYHIQQDPLSNRAYSKPRRYPGDAVLLDLIYRHPDGSSLLKNASEQGNQVYAFTSNSLNALAVRERKSLLTAELERVAKDRSEARILSVACGHLREAEDSQAIREGRYSEFIALDQDPESLSVVANRWSNSKIRATAARLSHLLNGTLEVGDFDLIYASGIYDYLNAEVAQKLTAFLAQRLRPGGRLLLANFLQGGRDIAYMESVLDWWLIYRTLEEIEDFMSALPSNIAHSHHVRQDSFGVIGYLSIDRK